MGIAQSVKKGLWEALAGAAWPGRDRRLWLFSHEKLGYRSTLFPLLALFFPHCVMALGLFLSGPICLIGVLVDPGEFPPPGEMLVMILFMTPVGGLFTVFLVPLILGRRATVLDRRRQIASEIRGVALPLLPMLPLWRRSHPWAGFDRVTLRLEHRAAGKSSCEVYAIALSGPEKTEPVAVVEARRFLSARACAERVAAFVSLPLRDETGLAPVIRPVAALDQPLVEREVVPVRTPPAPAPCRAEIAEDADGLSARLPAAPFTHWRKLGLALLFAFLAGLAYRGWQTLPPDRVPTLPSEVPSPDWEPPSPWPHRFRVAADHVLLTVGRLTALTAAGMLVVFAFHLLTWPRGYEMRADANGLRVRRRGPLFWRTYRMRTGELEELRLGGRGAVHHLTAISDRRTVDFAHGLPEEEARFLRTQLVEALRRTWNTQAQTES